MLWTKCSHSAGVFPFPWSHSRINVNGRLRIAVISGVRHLSFVSSLPGTVAARWLACKFEFPET